MDVSGFRRVLTTCAMALCIACVAASPAWAGGRHRRHHHHRHHQPQGPTVTPVASGLDNPRGLAFGQDGRLYVGEAGHGGGECIPAKPPVPPEPPEERPVSASRDRHIDAWVSIVSSPASSPRRPRRLCRARCRRGGWRDNGGLFAIVGESSDGIPPVASKFLSAKTIEEGSAQLGRLIKVHPGGQYKVVADVGHFDFQWTTEHKELVPEQFPDANPYGVLASEGQVWVVDAGANTLDRVRRTDRSAWSRSSRTHRSPTRFRPVWTVALTAPCTWES